MVTIENWLCFLPNHTRVYSFSLPTLCPFYISGLWGWKSPSHKRTDHKSTSGKKKSSTTLCQVKEASLSGLAIYSDSERQDSGGREQVSACWELGNGEKGIQRLQSNWRSLSLSGKSWVYTFIKANISKLYPNNGRENGAGDRTMFPWHLIGDKDQKRQGCELALLHLIFWQKLHGDSVQADWSKQISAL